jgi:hypothetical protein
MNIMQYSTNISFLQTCLSMCFIMRKKHNTSTNHESKAQLSPIGATPGVILGCDTFQIVRMDVTFGQPDMHKYLSWPRRVHPSKSVKLWNLLHPRIFTLLSEARFSTHGGKLSNSSLPEITSSSRLDSTVRPMLLEVDNSSHSEIDRLFRLPATPGSGFLSS